MPPNKPSRTVLPQITRPHIAGGGPRLDNNEWIILLDLFLRNEKAALTPNHPDLLKLAPVFAARAAKRGDPRRGTVLRSPSGLARRIGILRRLASGGNNAIPHEARAVWFQFSSDPRACAERANAILAQWGGDEPKPDGLTESLVKPSQGPAPFAGSIHVDRLTGPMSVYAMVLDGPAPLVLPTAGEQLNVRYVKIGISSDVARRTSELNRHFPPGLGIAWRCFHRVDALSPANAFAVEQAVLAELFETASTIGGEFAMLAPEALQELIEKHVMSIRSPPLTHDARECYRPIRKAGERLDGDGHVIEQ